jgi:aspartate-semialdehyde dehydrogenase
MSPADARDILSEFPGVRVIDDIASKSYPLADYAAGKDEIFVGRIRSDKAFTNGLSIWTVGDNLRKGAALNAVQIAEALLEQGLAGSGGNGR